jgi:hypothetical protein
MLDAQVATLENAIVRYLASGEVPGPLGSRHPSIAPFQALATGDGHIVVAAGNDALFAKLCRAVDRPELAQAEEFASNELRTRSADALARQLEAALASHGSAFWLEKLGAAGVPCGPVNDIAQVAADPQVAARNMLVAVAGTALRVAGNPVKLSGFEIPRCAPARRARRGAWDPASWSRKVAVDAPPLPGDRRRRERVAIALPARDPRGGGRARTRSRTRSVTSVAGAGGGCRRAAALLPAPRARKRPVLSGGDAHRDPGRRLGQLARRVADGDLAVWARRSTSCATT